jgi:hypothetical protein
MYAPQETRNPLINEGKMEVKTMADMREIEIQRTGKYLTVVPGDKSREVLPIRR